MNTRSIAAAFAAALCFASSTGAAAPPSDSPDALASVDRNRTAIIADIVEGFGEKLSASQKAAMKERLGRLRADRLLAASIVTSRSALEVVLAEWESHPAAAVANVASKAFGSYTRDLVYSPLTPCRLVDTRGFGAPITGGALAPNSTRQIVPAGACGIPAGIASLMVSFTTQNLTPTSGGYISFLAPGAPVTTTSDIFNINSEWSASITLVPANAAGNFDVFVAAATAHVIIDVLGYFSAPTPGAVGTAYIADGAVTAAKLNSNGCAAGQVMRYNGSAWTCSTALGCPAGTVAAAGLCAETLSPAGSFATAMNSCSSRDGQVATAAQSRMVWNNATARAFVFTASLVTHWAADFVGDTLVKTATASTSSHNYAGSQDGVTGNLQYFCVIPRGAY